MPQEAQAVVDSPLGPLLLEVTGSVLRRVAYDGLTQAVAGERTMAPEDAAVLAAATVQLAEYFAGERRVFDLPVHLQGTPFQEAVWRTVRAVPWGRTTTYAAVASKLGMPVTASRAVGRANAACPLPVVLPTHRVLGGRGSLVGYGGGLPRKAALLRLEGVATAADQLPLFD